MILVQVFLKGYHHKIVFLTLWDPRELNILAVEYLKYNLSILCLTWFKHNHWIKTHMESLINQNETCDPLKVENLVRCARSHTS